jgi:hypothetical protein
VLSMALKLWLKWRIDDDYACCQMCVVFPQRKEECIVVWLSVHSGFQIGAAAKHTAYIACSSLR